MSMARLARIAAGVSLAVAALFVASCGGGGGTVVISDNGGGGGSGGGGGGGGGSTPGCQGTGDGSTGVVRQAASCSAADVVSALRAATRGDTVQVPAGNCTWSGSVVLDKAVHLRGAGAGQTNITLNGDLSIVKQAGAVIRVSRFSFTTGGGGNANTAASITGAWSASPVIFQDNSFTINGRELFRVDSPGGFIFARNTVTAGADDVLFQLKDSANGAASWQTADSMGTRDTTGCSNHYMEDNTIRGGTTAAVDCDDGARCVYRHNTLTFSSFNSHGYETSPVGMRHFEVYNNTWLFPTNDPACTGSTQLSNQNWLVRLRGGTGVVFGNTMPNVAAACGWGDKDEIQFDIRSAEDATPPGVDGCTYPIPRQLGQSFDGTRAITDPIYLWNNNGTPQLGLGYSWGGNGCGRAFSYFFQANRDYVVGTPKPGYTPYTHPHPLVLPTP